LNSKVYGNLPRYVDLIDRPAEWPTQLWFLCLLHDRIRDALVRIRVSVMFRNPVPQPWIIAAAKALAARSHAAWLPDHRPERFLSASTYIRNGDWQWTWHLGEVAASCKDLLFFLEEHPFANWAARDAWQ
jgi:hypothetical protein